jgi:hypothetical protein
MNYNTVKLTDMEVDIVVEWKHNEFNITKVEDFKNSAPFLCENLDHSALERFAPKHEPGDQEAWENEMLVAFHQLSHYEQCELMLEILTDPDTFYDAIYEQIQISESDYKDIIADIRYDSMREEA